MNCERATRVGAGLDSTQESKESCSRFGRNIAVFLALFIGLAITGNLAKAQGGSTGAISGVVTDEKGGGVPAAHVVVTNMATGRVEREVETSGSGNYNVPSLQPGNYRVEVTAKGFAKLVVDGVVVQVTETATANATLKLGQLTESVLVSATATPVETNSAATGTTIGEHTVSNLPISTGNFFGLLALSSGANTELFDTAALGRGSVTLNVNGQRPTNNNFQIEGVNANDVNLPVLDNVALPNKESIEEFKTQTSLYDASQGRNGGGNVQVNLKSGTNSYHGETYEFFRNNILNANDWFLNQNSQARPVLRQNLFGANFGGPVPKIKDWFFYLSYQGTREASGASSGTSLNTTIPILPAARDQATLISTFFPNGLPAGVTSLDPTALKFMNLPASKCPGFNDGTHCIPTIPGTAGFTGGAIDTGTIARASQGVFQEDQYVISTDKQITSKDKFSGRFFFADTTTLDPFGTSVTLPFAESLPLSNRFLKLGWTHVFSSSIVNEFRFGFSRYNFQHQPTEPITLADIGATRANSSSVPAAYELNITGAGFSLGTAVNDNRGGAFNTFYPADDLSITRGKHLIRLGMDASRYQLNRFNNFATRGTVTYIDTPATNLNAFQNFLLGNIGNEQAGEGFTAFHFRATDYAAYIQDDWKFRPRFTLNLGLRWEGISTAHEKDNLLSNFAGLEDGTQQIIHIIHPAQLQGFGTPGVSSCTLQKCFSSGNFAPRVGFAWDLFGNQKTVVRSGYGIYYQRVSNQGLLQTAGGLPFQASLSLAPGATPENPFPTLLPPSAFPLPTDQSIPALTGFNAATGAPIFAGGGGPLASTFFFPVRDLRPPYAQQWNLTIQRELFKNWVLEAGYVGSAGSHLLTGRPLDAGQICTMVKPCTIPASIGTSVNVPAGTPFVTKNPDGSIAITGSTRANIDARVPWQYLGELDENLLGTAEEGRSHYHSLQATLSHRFSGGLYFQSAYTWSKSMDNTSGSTFQDELNGTLVALFGDPNSLNRMRGLSDFDRTHRLVISYDYEIPIGKWTGVSNAGFGKMINGWGLHGFTTIQSGTPFTVFDSNALELSDTTGFFGANFATLAPGQTLQSIQTHGSVQSRVGGWFIPLNQAFVSGGNCVDAQDLPVACSSPAAQGAALGNVGRNAFRGPSQQNWDMALTKQTKITERFGTQFRAEFFNLFNHPSFQSPQAFGAYLGNLGFVNVAGASSAITGTVSRPRIMQFALKLTF
jgi:Carboxypeptidase regulatory-like domain/TonB dependent receptor